MPILVRAQYCHLYPSAACVQDCVKFDDNSKWKNGDEVLPGVHKVPGHDAKHRNPCAVAQGINSRNTQEKHKSLRRSKATTHRLWFQSAAVISSASRAHCHEGRRGWHTPGLVAAGTNGCHVHNSTTGDGWRNATRQWSMWWTNATHRLQLESPRVKNRPAALKTGSRKTARQ